MPCVMAYAQVYARECSLALQHPKHTHANSMVCHADTQASSSAQRRQVAQRRPCRPTTTRVTVPS